FDFRSYLNWDPFERPTLRSGFGWTNRTCVGGPSWPVQSSIARWLCSIIAGPVCADHLTPVRSTFAWKKNFSRLRVLKNACTECAPRSRQAIRQQSRPSNHNRLLRRHRRIALALPGPCLAQTEKTPAIDDRGKLAERSDIRNSALPAPQRVGPN